MTSAEKGSGYMSPETVGCQFSVYPLRQLEIGDSIEAAVKAARAQGCMVRVGNLSTLIAGTEDQVFAALKAGFRAAQARGPAVLTATIVAGMPTDELVADIQARLEGEGG